MVSRRQIAIGLVGVSAALAAWSVLQRTWVPLLCLVPVLPLAWPAFGDRVESRRLPNAIWTGFMLGTCFGVVWFVIWGDTARTAVLKGVAFGVAMALVEGARWERTQQRMREQEARRALRDLDARH